MGEYQALSRLNDAAKDRVVPLIVIPEIEFDFEEWQEKKTLQEHVEPFPKRYKEKWGKRPAWIDVHPKIIDQKMDDGSLPIDYVFRELRKFEHQAVPVTSLDVDAEINSAVAKIVAADKRGVGIRARVEHVMKGTFVKSLEKLLADIGVQPTDADLVIDLGSPSFKPYIEFANALKANLNGVDLRSFRSLVLLGCAYPQNILLEKPGGVLERHDWLFYCEFVSSLTRDDRIPNYGDYTIVNPEFTPMDMRKIKSGGKLVYTDKKNWIIRKGGPFRDNPGQMHDHCDFIVSSGKFRGAAFSGGDDYIEKCAKRSVGASNQPFWKQVAINHHMMHVLEDLSTFFAPA
jgi:hypothetical protein